MKILTLGLTSSCSQGCRHCLYSCKSGGVDLDLSLAKRILKEAGNMDFSCLRLTGGEPFLYPHLEEILSYATFLKFSIEIETSGSEFTQYIDMLKPYNILHIVFSLSGACEHTHDFIRGLGSFEKTICNIESADRHNFLVKITYTIDNLNIGEFYDAITLLNSLPVSFTTINEVISAGRALENNLHITPDLLPHYIPFISSKLPAGKFRFSSNYASGHCSFIKGGNCFVNWNGEISLCSNAAFDKKIADLNTCSFSEGFRKLSLFTTDTVRKSAEPETNINCASCTLDYNRDIRLHQDISDKIKTDPDLAKIANIKIPKALNVLITKQCNFTCNFCEFDCKPDGPSIDIDLLGKLLREGSMLGIREVIFDGGEPLLCKSFEEALRLASHYGYKTTVLTNGWYFNDFLPVLKKYNVYRIIFGIDGATARTNDFIKKKKGAYKRVIEAIRLSKKNQFVTGLHYVTSAHNYNELDDFICLSQSLAVDYLMIGRVFPLGRALAGKGLSLSEEQQDSIRAVYAKHHDFFKTITTSCAYTRGSEKRALKGCYYLNMAEHLAVDWHGRTVLCALSPMFDLPFPSLSEHSLLDCIIELSEINRRFCWERDLEFLDWKPGRKYLFCEYCLERFRESPERYFERYVQEKQLPFHCASY